MHKTSSNTKIAFTVEKIIIKRFEVSSSKPIPVHGEQIMRASYYDILDFKCFVRDMNTRSFQELTATGVVL
jgi:hypothetical protein